MFNIFKKIPLLTGIVVGSAAFAAVKFSGISIDGIIDHSNSISEPDYVYAKSAETDVSQDEAAGISTVDQADSSVAVSSSVSDEDAAAISASVETPSPHYEVTSVDDSYFDDALFIGDSRTVGLFEYNEEIGQRADSFCKVSFTIYRIFDETIKAGQKGTPPVRKNNALPDSYTLEELLTNNHYGKVYIMLGINELGTGTTEDYAQAYQDVVTRIRELQPDAIIYIQGMMHVSGKKSEVDKLYNNVNVNERNEAVSKLADGEKIFYIDMNEAVDDENGDLRKDLTFDDVHLYASSYILWHDFLINHAYVLQK